MEKLTAEQFASAEGLQDWRVVGWQACTVFRTGDFETGLRLVAEVGRLAEAADHHPDLNLRYPVLEVRLATHSESALTDKDVTLARQITAAAEELGVAADPDAVARSEVARTAD